MTKAELRRCKSLSARQLRRNSKCEAALQTEKKPVVRSLTKAELRHCKGLSERQLKRNSKCKVELQAEKKPAIRKVAVVKSLSKADQRRCKKMSYSQLVRNKDCAALLQRELIAGERTKHRSEPKRATKTHRKADTSRQSRQKGATHRS